MASSGAHKLTDFLRSNRERILADWARLDPLAVSARGLSREALLASLPRLLESLAEATRSAATGQPATFTHYEPGLHAAERMRQGFSLEDTAAEYRLLRQCLFRLSREVPGRLTLDELELLNSLLDEALIQSTAAYARASHEALQSSEAASRRQAERTHRLQRVTAGLSSATTPDQVVDVVVSEGVEALGAQSGVLCLLSQDEQWFELVKAVGYPEGLLLAWRRFPADTPVMFREAVRKRRPVLYGTLEAFLVDYPHLAEAPTVTGNQAFATVPLMLEGRCLGTLGLSFARPQSFSGDDRGFMMTLATQCAQALERARLYEAERTEVMERRRAEAALRVSEERFRSLVLATSQMLWTTNAEGEVAEDSPSWRAFTGQRLEEWLGQGWLDVVHPEDRKRTAKAWQEAVASKRLYEVEYRIRRPEGSYTHTLVRGAPVLNPDGSVREWVGTHSDITARKVAEEGLRFHVEVGQVLSESIDIGTTLKNITRLAVSHLADFCTLDLLDKEGELRRLEVLAADPVQNELIQASRQYPPLVKGNTPMARVLASGEPHLEYIDSGWLDRAARNAEHRAILERLKPTAAALLPLKARGRTLGLLNLIWKRTHSLPGKKELALAMAVADRAALALDNARLYEEARVARAQAEDALALLDSFFAASPIGFVVLAPRLERVLRVNARLCELLGHQADELMGRPLFQWIHPEDRDADQELLQRMFRGELPVYAADKRYVRKDGGIIWVHMTATLLPQRGGEPPQALAILEDITERKRAEQELQRSGVFREQFIGILGHDLRGPLSAVKASIGLLIRANTWSDSQLRALRRIDASTDRMTRMIGDILDFARGRLGGGIPVERLPADLHEIARHAVEELAVAYPGRTLEFHAEGSGGGAFDTDRISQVVSNLVSNALTHGEQDKPVRVTAREWGPSVELEVWNPGSPIPPELLPTMFEPFRRGMEKTSSTGLGLGLYIVAEVVKAHGGQVEVRSTQEQGTSFTVRLPRASPPPP